MAIAFMAVSAVILSACDGWLDQEPQSEIPPEMYFEDISQLDAYTNNLYSMILPNGQFLTSDQHTDNQAYITYSDKYVPGEWKVSQTDGSNWYFGAIYECNYFLENVLRKYDQGLISGSDAEIRHCIGEVYFLRAFEYFRRYQMFGDFPIVEETMPNDAAELTEASRRMPRNEVARFIISDLDKAAELMAAAPASKARKTYLSKDAALLVKSRVALYEGTFLKYFKGTAFVPLGPEWPGFSKSYNASYQYPSGDIDSEIEWFLNQAMTAAKEVADGVVLTENTGRIRQSVDEPENPYMDMYANVNPDSYDEVILWREYNSGLGVSHAIPFFTQKGNWGTGVTRGYVDCFLMSNGLPIYAAGSGYAGDDYISYVRKDRDSRLFLFLKEPGQLNLLTGDLESANDAANPVEQYPNIIGLDGFDVSRVYTTGYALRKGNSWDLDQLMHGNATGSYTGLVIFRGVEAMLNYIEASYELNNVLDGTATAYWQAIRSRARVNTDLDVTFNATDISREAGNDWGAYSGGRLLTDPVLYNIRRERRCEFLGEGMRWADLQRWRSLDQMISEPYHIEGIKIWGPMKEWYNDGSGQSLLVYGLDNPSAVVSPPDRSEYLLPYEKVRGSLALDGYRWAMAHYLNPVALQDVLVTSEGNNVETSPIYQNPGWSLTVGEGALQ